jgi:hypothetical protein
MERAIELPQGTIRVYEQGDGPVLFFVHGCSRAIRSGGPVTERLAALIRDFVSERVAAPK